MAHPHIYDLLQVEKNIQQALFIMEDLGDDYANGSLSDAEMQTEDCLNLMEGIAEAYGDPGFRDCVNFRRAEIIDACQRLLTLLTKS